MPTNRDQQHGEHNGAPDVAGAPAVLTREQEVQRAWRNHLSPFGYAATVTVEDRYLLPNAVTSYVHGADAATIFCAHAACERALAAELRDQPPAGSVTPKDLDRWGLGRMIRRYRELDALPIPLLDDLSRLNSRRTSLYHFGHTEKDDALTSRAFEGEEESPYTQFERENGFAPDNKEAWQFALDRRLRRDALAALETVFRLRTVLYTP